MSLYRVFQGVKATVKRGSGIEWEITSLNLIFQSSQANLIFIEQ